MIADLKPYPEYKKAGADWLGDVPAHWEVRNLRTMEEIRADILTVEKEAEGLLDELLKGDSG